LVLVSVIKMLLKKCKPVSRVLYHALRSDAYHLSGSDVAIRIEQPTQSHQLALLASR
jgi:hypothetical protein